MRGIYVWFVVRNKLGKYTFSSLIIYFVRFSFNDNGVLVWNYTVYSCKVKVKDRRKQIKLIVDVTWKTLTPGVISVWVKYLLFVNFQHLMVIAWRAIWCRSNLFLFSQNWLFTFMIFCVQKIKWLIIICLNFLNILL